MSNFKNWRTPGALEEFQRKQLEQRLDLNAAKQTSGQLYAEKCRSNAPAKAPRKPKTPKPTPARPHIGTTFVGVDPALRKGGFWVCIICRVDNTATFKSCKHLGEFVRILQDAEPAAVIVENSNLQKAVFDKGAGVGGAISVGKNQGVSQAAADIADQYSEIPSGISPKQKGAKVTNEALFSSIARSNNLTLCKYKGGDGIGQDQRDAMMLALIAEQQFKLHLKVRK